jgi:excisionase family DNA binding protein
MSSTISVTDGRVRIAWSLGEAAGLLGVSERFLWNEVRRGKLAVVKRGRRVLVPVSSLDDYLRQSSTPQHSETLTEVER